MKAKKLLIWMWVGLALLAFAGIDSAQADKIFSLSTLSDWEEAMANGHIRRATQYEWDRYMEQSFEFSEGLPYPYSDSFKPAEFLGPYEGGGEHKFLPGDVYEYP